MGIFKRFKALEEQNASMSLHIAELKKAIADMETWKKCHDECHLIDEKNIRTSFRNIGSEIKKIEEKIPAYEDAIAKGVDDVWNKAVQSIIDFNPYKSAMDGDG